MLHIQILLNNILNCCFCGRICGILPCRLNMWANTSTTSTRCFDLLTILFAIHTHSDYTEETHQFFHICSRSKYYLVDCVWNVMAHAQKPDFGLSPKRTSLFKSAGASVQSTTNSRGVRISGINAGYTMIRGSAKSTGYPLHSPVSPSFPLSYVTVCHHSQAKPTVSVPVC
jgi:hypothetical protein